ncbi:MAG: FtsW/RodA/SpoVE family cell cycle protein, partial [Bacteroidota bacterium]
FTIGKAFPGSVQRIDTWVARIEAFFTPDEVDRHSLYQSEQSKIAIATGGITGKGPGNSNQRNFLPHPYSDFIYAIVLEEYGLMGGTALLLLYLILLFRSIRISVSANRTFAALLAVGISFMLVFQALINMAVAVNLFPVTGQPLPLVSMGGTSIWITCIAIGIVLSVSRGVEEESTKNNKKND